MARVWREGQQRPVYVYRMITADRIEEAIYQVPLPPSPCLTLPSQRQRVKEGLHSVISLGDAKRASEKEVEGEEEGEEDVEEELPESDPEDPSPAEEEEVSPWLADIWSLVWPSPSHATAPLPPPGSVGYQDELLDTITSASCRQVR
jgi:hypothetical protein